jgi:hypothetical protein
MATSVEETRLTDYAAKAQQALADHTQACVKQAEATRILAKLDSERADQKVAAIYRLLECEFTPGKKFTVTQAGDFTLLDRAYREYKDKVQQWTQVRLEHDLHRETAKLATELYVALARSEARLI